MKTMLGIGRIQHRLARSLRNRCNGEGETSAEATRGTQDLFAFLDRSVVPKQQRNDRHPLRSGEQGRERLGLVGQRCTEVTVEPKYRMSLVQRVQHHATQHLCHWMKTILE